MQTLNDLILEEKNLIDSLSENRKQQREIYTQMFFKEHGISIGDTVEFIDGREKVIGVFDHIEYSGVKPNYPIIRIFNSDGNVGKREKRCYTSGLETIKVIKPA